MTFIPETGIGAIIDEHSDKTRFLAWGKGDDECLLELINECVKRNKIAIYLMPSMEVYSPLILRAIEIGKDSFHLHELERGTVMVLHGRAHKYCQYWPQTFLMGRL